jgi:opine dehydrogenase
MAEIGGWLGVKTPVMDALIQLASVVSRTEYRRDGLTLAKMGLGKVDTRKLPSILQNGF